MMHMLQRLRRFTTLRSILADSDSGVAAVEFAILMPIIVALFLTATDCLAGLTVARRSTQAVNTIAEIMSQNPSQVVADSQVVLAMDSVLTTMPNVLNDAANQGKTWQADVTMVVSEADFTYTSSNGSTTAAITWSVGNNATKRTCGTPTRAGTDSFALVDGSGAPVLTTLPNSLYIPYSTTAGNLTYSFIVVDLVYKFNPTFIEGSYSWLQSALTFHRVAYLPPRLFTALSYSTSSNSGTQTPPLTGCPSS
jgi:Flp pilus assembly protein TadG